jgi:hypothetical protein
VPEGVCVAVTVAPTKGSPLLAVTVPLILLVVTCAKGTNGIIIIVRTVSRILLIRIKVFFFVNKESKK